MRAGDRAQPRARHDVGQDRADAGAGTTQLGTLTSVQVGDVIDTGKLNISVAELHRHAHRR
jgi:hypothetical protein